MKTDLLDQLASQLGCDYLSDLKCVENLQRIRAILDKMDSNNFCVAEWDYVLSYLLETEVRAQTPAEAAKLLSMKHRTD